MWWLLLFFSGSFNLSRKARQSIAYIVYVIVIYIDRDRDIQHVWIVLLRIDTAHYYYYRCARGEIMIYNLFISYFVLETRTLTHTVVIFNAIVLKWLIPYHAFVTIAVAGAVSVVADAIVALLLFDNTLFISSASSHYAVS